MQPTLFTSCLPRTASPADGGAGHVRWSPDGRTLAVAGGDVRRTYLYDRATWQPLPALTSGLGGELAAAGHGGVLRGKGRKLTPPITALPSRLSRWRADGYARW